MVERNNYFKGWGSLGYLGVCVGGGSIRFGLGWDLIGGDGVVVLLVRGGYI